MALGKIKKRILLRETRIKCQSRADIGNLKAGRTSKQSHHEDTLLFLKAMSSGYCLSPIPSSQWSRLYSYLALSVLKWDFLHLPTQFLPEAQSTLLSQDTISNCASSAASGTPPPAWPLVTILHGLLGFCCRRFWTTGILKLAPPKAFPPPHVGLD